jgi:hypothetical protein
VVFTGSEEEKRALSRSHNDVRRHLSEIQRSLRANDAARLKYGTNQHAGKEEVSLDTSSTITISNAAKKQNVSVTSVKRARCVTTHGIEELQAALRAERVSLLVAAQIARMTPAEQRKCIKNGFKLPKKPKTVEQKPVVEDVAPSPVIAPEPEVATAPVKVIPAEPLTHVERLERLIALLKDEINDLKRVEGWADTKERCAAVRTFMKTYRKLGNEFEKYTTVGAEPDKTLFESDADIPEHLSTQEFLASWNSWWAHRKQRKLSVSDVTKKRQLNLLAIGDAEQAAAIVSKAEENKWQGIPDGIWVPSRNCGLWCDRMPAHASAELTAKIRSALPTVNASGQIVVQPIKVDRSAWGSRIDPEFEKLSPEEQRKFVRRRK